MTADYPRRGELYYADLDPVLGSEQGGRRPVLVLQNDVGNEHSPVTIVASVTSAPAKVARPTDVPVMSTVSGLTAPSRILLNQIRTLDKRRLGRRLGQLAPEEMAQVEEALKVSLGMVPL